MVIWDRYTGFDSDPFAEFENLRRRMNRVLGIPMRLASQESFPPVNLWSNSEKAAITAEIPGVKKEDLEISVENDVLTIKGHREPEEVCEGEAFRRRERGHGAFRRSIALPFSVDPEKVDAEYKDGVLRVELTRHETSKPRQIEVR